MSTFVLVHGSWTGAWCWYKVIPRLERAGYRVIAPDLPSLGSDKTPISQVSLRIWVERVCLAADIRFPPRRTGPLPEYPATLTPMEPRAVLAIVDAIAAVCVDALVRICAGGDQ